MNFKVTITFILLLSINLFAQEVTLESEKMTSEQERVQNIEAEIRKLSDENYKSWMQFEKTQNQLSPLNVVLYPTREKLDKKIQDIEQTLYEMQRLGLKQKCEQINTLSSSIGGNTDNCSSLENRKRRLNERHKEVINEIAELQRKEKEGEKSKNKELTVSFGKNERDDFWNGVSDKTDESSKNSDDDFWNGKSETVADIDNEDDFWNGKEKIENEDDSLLNDKTSLELEIFYENNKQGLRDKKTQDVIVNAIYGSIKYFEYFDFFDFFVAYKPEDSSRRVRDWGKGEKFGVLMDNYGKIILTDFDYAHYDSGLLKVHSYRSTKIKETYIAKHGWNKGKKMTLIDYNRDEVFYDKDMNVVKKININHGMSIRSSSW